MLAAITLGMFAETILNLSPELLRLFLRFRASSRGKMMTFAYLHPSLTITEKLRVLIAVCQRSPCSSVSIIAARAAPMLTD